jgi:surfeit locus 1 family protein
MYRFLLRPRWVISHVLVLALVITMINLGLWQLRRLDFKKDRIERIETRSTGDPKALATALPANANAASVDSLDFQLVSATGTFESAAEFLIPQRTLDGAPGRHVVTPFHIDGTDATVLVLRGFIPMSVTDSTPPIDTVEAPSGTVTIRGWLRKPEVAGPLQNDNAKLSAAAFSRLDVASISKNRGLDYLPMYVQLKATDPPTEAPLLTPVALPELDEGPHLSYAAQWAIFTLIALIGYPLVLRRVAKGGSVPEEDSDEVYQPPVPPTDPAEVAPLGGALAGGASTGGAGPDADDDAALRDATRTGAAGE